MNDIKISGFDKLTLLNYPNKVACTIFTKGCNFKCPFCHNAELLDINNDYSTIDESVIFTYLEKRKGLLDGVCISGGEPLIQKGIKEFIKKIKDLGYLIKIDTNGSNPQILQELIDEKLVDYVAMDIKNTWDKYNLTAGCNIKLDNIKKSIDIMENSPIDYEFRTTIIKKFHNIDDIKEIGQMLKNKSKYYLQNFVKSDGVLNKNLMPFTIDELKDMQKKLKKDYPNITFRDL